VPQTPPEELTALRQTLRLELRGQLIKGGFEGEEKGKGEDGKEGDGKGGNKMQSSTTYF